MSKKNSQQKTNVMRILDSSNIDYKAHCYNCPEFLDGVSIASKLCIPVDQTFKTLVTIAKSKQYYVFVIPVAEELDLKKAASSVKEKSIEMIHVKDINAITGYIRGGCSPIGMKKSFPTVMDSTAQSFNTVFFSGGARGIQIEMNPNDLSGLIDIAFFDIKKTKAD